jgi:hypothetical protein
LEDPSLIMPGWHGPLPGRGSLPCAPDVVMSDLQIVEAFSLIVVPDDILRASNLPEMVNDMMAAQAEMASSTKSLEALRKEKEGSHFLANFWNDQNDKIKDAQFELNRAIVTLTVRSSNLLIVNTAMAKILNSQQVVLQKHQVDLKNQANHIQRQNEEINAQQEMLRCNQIAINAANQGLLEAKGLTQAQAQQLVGCVEKVKSSEKQILAAHEQLIDEVEMRVGRTAKDCTDMVSARLAQFNDAHLMVEKRVDGRLKVQDIETDSRFGAVEKQQLALTQKIEALEKNNVLISSMLEKQRKGMRAHRIALAALTIIGLGGWIAAIHFAVGLGQ